jgi:hypothetical protein
MHPRRNSRIRKAQVRRECRYCRPDVEKSLHSAHSMRNALSSVNAFCIAHPAMRFA